MSKLIVTVDGPSGTGKSTVSRAVASKAGLPHLDTGAFYRAATLACLRAGADLGDQSDVITVVENLLLDQADGRMQLDGEDISEEIRSETVTNAVSEVSAHPDVRTLLVEHQRSWVTQHGDHAVVEGRDIGSVVFPDATLKVYLDARPEVRAMRRATQLGEEPSEVVNDLARRDYLDSTRQASPLTIPEGAVVVDTSDMTFDEVVETVVKLVESKS
jgi:cytidylate kinase